MVGHNRSLATFDQISHSVTDSLGIAKKLSAKLVVLMPAYDLKKSKEGREPFMTTQDLGVAGECSAS